MMWITPTRLTELAKSANRAAKKGDLQTVATINKDDDLRSANMQFMVRGKVCYVALLNMLDRTTPEKVTQEVVSE